MPITLTASEGLLSPTAQTEAFAGLTEPGGRRPQL